MKDFKPVEISDREKVIKLLDNFDCPTLEYNFTTMFIWQKIYGIEICEHNGFLHERTGDNVFLFPAGKGDIKKETDFIIDISSKTGKALRFFSLSPLHKEFLEANYPGRFSFEEIRNSEDYIYTSESLRTLAGKKLSSKRNHINRFIENNPEWRYEAFNDINIAEAVNMHDKWCEGANCDGSESLQEETCAVKRAFKYYNELGLSGGVLRIDSGVCAFSMGDRLNNSTFLVHIEKAFADIQGAYPMINKQFVINNCDGYEFVNREDDTGDEGLRKAKLSYCPYKLMSKYKAVEV